MNVIKDKESTIKKKNNVRREKEEGGGDRRDVEARYATDDKEKALILVRMFLEDKDRVRLGSTNKDGRGDLGGHFAYNP